MSLPVKQKGKGFQHAESILALGFLAVILLGTVLLALPAASRSGKGIGLFDSLFTATSAVCVTGLVAVDTGTTFSVFGQIVLLVLIQVGGLGFMAFATMIMVALGRKISIRDADPRIHERSLPVGSRPPDMAVPAPVHRDRDRRHGLFVHPIGTASRMEARDLDGAVPFSQRFLQCRV